jgi:hypothetical protein
MFVETIVRLGHTGSSAFSRNRVAAHRINLRHNRDAEFWVDFGGGDGGAQPRTSASHEKNVVRPDLHGSPLAAAI